MTCLFSGLLSQGVRDFVKPFDLSVTGDIRTWAKPKAKYSVTELVNDTQGNCGFVLVLTEGVAGDVCLASDARLYYRAVYGSCSTGNVLTAVKFPNHFVATCQMYSTKLRVVHIDIRNLSIVHGSGDKDKEFFGLPDSFMEDIDRFLGHQFPWQAVVVAGGHQGCLSFAKHLACHPDNLGMEVQHFSREWDQRMTALSAMVNEARTGCTFGLDRVGQSASARYEHAACRSFVCCHAQVSCAAKELVGQKI
jgi:hypothetical protein